MVYAVTALRLRDGVHFLAATELYGQWHHFAPPDYNVRIASHAPGGVLGFTALPDGSGRLLAIERAYPIYHFAQAAITLSQPSGGPGGLWTKQHLADLPYVHRIGVMAAGNTKLLVASTMCGRKQHQEDWSAAGAVYASVLPDMETVTTLSFQPIHEGLSRNHGMQIAPFQGVSTLFVSGMEGVYALNPVESDGVHGWQSRQMLARDVSDIALFDLDGDGREEMVTIEPFHGDTVGIYRQTDSDWVMVAQQSVNFGHVAWAGMMHGRRCLLLGSRGGRQDLRLLIFRGDGSLAFETLTLDENTGPANVAVVHEPDRVLILSANHVRGEVALYEIRD